MDPAPDIWTLLAETAVRTPGAPAVGCAESGAGPDACVDYRALFQSATRRAVHLRELGIGPGDRVAILAPNGRPFLELYFAVAGLGAILVPLHAGLGVAEIDNVLADAGASLLVFEGDVPATSVERLALDQLGREGSFEPARVDHDTVAHLYYTSGTTGDPKGVMLTHGNVCHHASAAIHELALTSEDTWAHIAPMFHLADAWAVFAITQVGGRHVMLSSFDACDALRCVANDGITLTNLVPTMLHRMLAEPLSEELEYPTLRLMLSGGAPIAAATVRTILATFGRGGNGDYAQTYGMTETSPYLTISLLHEHLRALPAEEQLRFKAKTGRPFHGVTLRVVDQNGAPVPHDGIAVGEIQVRGPTVTPGYWNRPDATAAAFVDGWLATGDLATIDAEGYLDIVDRKKDVILSGGETIYSFEIEDVLYRHAAVAQAAVFGRPDPEWGEVVCAAVVLREDARGVDAEALREFCREHLARFQVPRVLELREDLPRTGSGKVAKRMLRDGVR